MLAVTGRYDVRKNIIVTGPVRWEKDGHGGFLCDEHARGSWHAEPDSPQDRQRRPAEKEKTILSALNQAGKTPLQLSQETGLPRSTVYDRLGVMTERGQVEKKNKMYFVKNVSVTCINFVGNG